MPVLTIGRSTRKAEQFLALLDAHRVAMIVNIGAAPRSRWHPTFTRDLEALLRTHDIGSTACADHMQTPGFREAIEQVVALQKSLSRR